MLRSMLELGPKFRGVSSATGPEPPGLRRTFSLDPCHPFPLEPASLHRMTRDTFLFVLSLAWLAVLIGATVCVIFD